MNAIEQIGRLHQHRMWANGRLIAAARKLSDEQLRTEFEIGQGSVWQTITHLMAAEYVWLEALLGNESPVMPGDAPDQLPGNQRGDDPMTSIDDLAQFWGVLDQRWCDHLQTLTEASLDDVVTKVITRPGVRKSARSTRSDILLHVCTHAQYTTAQLVNMLRQLGADELPDVMLITMAREERIA